MLQAAVRSLALHANYCSPSRTYLKSAEKPRTSAALQRISRPLFHPATTSTSTTDCGWADGSFDSLTTAFPPLPLISFTSVLCRLWETKGSGAGYCLYSQQSSRSGWGDGSTTGHFAAASDNFCITHDSATLQSSGSSRVWGRDLCSRAQSASAFGLKIRMWQRKLQSSVIKDRMNLYGRGNQSFWIDVCRSG